MSESTRAVPCAAIGIWRYVKDDIVWMGGISGHARHPLELIEIESMARSPSDHVIGA